jgi:hypothetical protein
MGCSVAPVKHRLRLLLFLCCAVWLCWGNRALAQDSTTPSPRDAPPGDTPPGKRTAGPASPAGADADASSSDHADASADAEQPSFGYRVNGHMFSIEGTRGQRSMLGTTRLPRPGREPPLILGKAAYVVLPGDGLAVVDIGLARFPYVVWRLSPDLAVRSINLDGNTLRVTIPAKSVLRVALCGGAVLWVAPHFPLAGKVGALAGSVVFFVAYFALLFASRELSISELLASRNPGPKTNST